MLSARITMLLAHVQLLAGFGLYLISPKVVFSAQSMSSPILRFFLVEHIMAMILAIALITFGVVRAKRKSAAAAGTLTWTLLVALILLIAMIPWPWSAVGGNWF
jgi:cell division protein FtsW (lipid II flippase)